MYDQTEFEADLATFNTYWTETLQRNVELGVAPVPVKGYTGVTYYKESADLEVELFIDGATFGVFRTIDQAEAFIALVGA